MDEARHNLVLVTYTDIESFLRLMKTNAGSVNLDRLETKRQLSAGFCITPYVIVQIRIDDELHLLKLIGESYHYWGDQFDDHQVCRQEALGWAKDLIAACLQTFLKQGVMVIVNSHYSHPDLFTVAGIFVEDNIPSEFN